MGMVLNYSVMSIPNNGLDSSVKQNSKLNSMSLCFPHSIAYKGNRNKILRGKNFLTDGHRCNQGFRMHEEISLSYVENALAWSSLFPRDLRELSYT